MLSMLDTTEFLTPEEEQVLEFFQNNNTRPTLVGEEWDLIHKGFLGEFFVSDHRYVYNHKSSEAVPITFTFKPYKINIINKDGTTRVLLTEEQNKLALMRKWVARWVFKKDLIKDEDFKWFLHTYSTFPFIYSCPKFLMPLIQSALVKTVGVEIKIITPDIHSAKCQYCGESFTSTKKGFDSCPKCGEKVLLR